MALSRKEIDRRYRERHPGRRAEIEKRYRQANPEKVKAKNARWRAANPDKVKAFKRDPVLRAATARRSAIKHAARIAAYHKRYQIENKERLQQQRREYWQTKRKAMVKPGVIARRAWIDSFKDRPCADCGHTFPPCAMDFDHVSGEKVASVSQMMFAPQAVVLEEINKCELVCANCHRVRTFNRTRARLESIAS